MCARIISSLRSANASARGRAYVFSVLARHFAAAPRVPFTPHAVNCRQVLECAGRAQRRRRFGFPAHVAVDAGFRRRACAESKAAWRFASRRTPKTGAACSRSSHNSTLGCAVALNTYGPAEQQPGRLRPPLLLSESIRFRTDIIAFVCTATLLLTSAVNAQEYTFTTLLGAPETPGAIDGPASAARLNYPQGVAVDSAGNLYVAEGFNHTIRKVTPAGEVTTLAGLAGTSGSANGTGSAARFNFPAGLAVDIVGNVYVADQYNSTIRKITPGGVVRTLAGLASNPGSTDATGSAARFCNPNGVAVDNAGNLYVADSCNYTIRKITTVGMVSTLAGMAGSSGSEDGAGNTARFSYLTGVAVDSTGNLYVTDGGNDTIRKITPAGEVTTLAGDASIGPSGGGYADGTGTNAQFRSPRSVAVDGAGNIYVADASNYVIRKVTPEGVVTTLAGMPGISGSIDGTGSAARFGYLDAIAVDSAGNIYVADVDNANIRKVTPDGQVSTLTGLASVRDFGGGVAVDAAGNLYGSGNARIFKLTTDRNLTTLAGQPGNPGNADGIGSAAQFRPDFTGGNVALDNVDNIFVADASNHTIRKVTPDGEVTTLTGAYIIGTGGNPIGGFVDGTGSDAQFGGPTGVAVDSTGNLYVADLGNNAIRKVTPEGIVTTLAGSPSYGSNDGTGSGARFSEPRSVAVDSAGNVYVADYVNSTIRKVTPARVVTTIGGLAGAGGSADGTGREARFDLTACCAAVAVDSAGNLYVSERGRIRIGTPNTCADRPNIDLTSAPVGQMRQLDTSPQTAVTWRWTQIRQPAGSSAKLSATNVRNPTFTPDVADLYVFRLFATNAAGAICIRTVSLTATPRVFIPPNSLAQTNGQFSFTLLSPAGSAVEIQASADLSSWVTLAALTNVTGMLPFTASAGTFNQRFYRALQLP